MNIADHRRNVGVIAAVFFPTPVKLDEEEDGWHGEDNIPNGNKEIGAGFANRVPDNVQELTGHAASEKASDGAPDRIGRAKLAVALPREKAHQHGRIPDTA